VYFFGCTLLDTGRFWLGEGLRIATDHLQLDHAAFRRGAMPTPTFDIKEDGTVVLMTAVLMKSAVLYPRSSTLVASFQEMLL